MPKAKKKPLAGILPEHLTPKQRDELRAMLAIGVPNEDACWAVGLHPSVLKRWLAAPYVPGEAISEFVASIRASVGRGVAKQVKIIFDGAGQASRLKAAQWWLSKQRPEKFANETPAFGAGPQGAPSERAGDINEERLRQALTVLEDEGASFPEEVRNAVLAAG